MPFGVLVVLEQFRDSIIPLPKLAGHWPKITLIYNVGLDAHYSSFVHGDRVFSSRSKWGTRTHNGIPLMVARYAQRLVEILGTLVSILLTYL